MNINNIKDSWGTIIELDSPEEFFVYNPDYWRDLAYRRKLIFFKKVNFTKAQYSEFSFYFGQPWSAEEYKYSREMIEEVNTKNGTQIISPFNNANTKMVPNAYMPWHADIPNRDFKPYPFRSLWITENPSPEHSGKTSWMNLEESFKYLTPEMLEMLPQISVCQQSWYSPGTDTKEFPLLKIHPITGAKSLRLNHYNWGTQKGAWITDVKVNNISQGNCFLIRQWIDHLQKTPELIYQHQWDTYDIAIYDNHSFIHSRTALTFDPATSKRLFFRININHLNDQEWNTHVKKYF
jgi:alpha-ketoglutarate-dependent taurine dioxygenase